MNYREYDNSADRLFALFNKYISEKKGIVADVMLSEEGGRFFYEENRNSIIELDFCDTQNFGKNYLWVTYSTLNKLIESNNVLNIQLRNLMTLLPLGRR
jgi:oxidase EvaA